METPRYSSLAEVRQAIDRLDRRLVDVLAERAVCVDAAARFKTSADGVRDPERVDRMVAERRQWAEAAGLDPDFVEALFRSVTSYFIGRELTEWRGREPDPPA